MKRYIVFLKQVPKSTKVGIDPVTKTVTRDNGESVQQLRVAMPCAIVAGKEFMVNPPTLEGWRRAQKQHIECWNEDDLAVSRSEVGLQASPTKVVTTEVVDSRKDTQ